VVKVGEELEVMVMEIDRMGRVNLSRRAVLEGKKPEDLRQESGARQERPDRGGDRDPDRGDRGGRDRDRGPRR